ncbi:MAG: NAD-binding protein [Nitrospira sp.]|nr:NAD-binding protein [Nitrospira sp.]
MMLDICRQPASLLVLGGGLVAVEFAQFFTRIGTKVTVLQRSTTLLSDMDEDIGQALAAAFQEEGIEVITGVSFQRVTSTPSGEDRILGRAGLSTRDQPRLFFLPSVVAPT